MAGSYQEMKFMFLAYSKNTLMVPKILSVLMLFDN